jgi:hypothetical protein
VKVNIQQDQYVGELSEPAGIRVVIHDQYMMPFPEDDGYYAQTGRLTSFAITKVQLTLSIHMYVRHDYKVGILSDNSYVIVPSVSEMSTYPVPGLPNMTCIIMGLLEVFTR